MRALWFLTWRLLVNSIRRTLRHPVRAVVFALVVGWFGFMMVGNLIFAISTRMRTASYLPPDFTLISMDNLIALIMAVHLTMLWQPLTPWTGFSSVPLFTPADVNFLFPSPQKRLTVFFFLLFTRGLANSLFTLLILVFMVLTMGNELVVSALAGRHPSHAVLSWTYPLMYLLAFSALLVAGILIALREERQEGFRRLLSAAFWCVVGLLAGMLGIQGYRAWSAGYEPLQEVVWHVLYNPVVAMPLLPLRALAEAALVFYRGWSPYVTAGFLLWGSFAAAMVWLLVRQEGWLYDLAAKMSALTTAYTLRRRSPAQAAYADIVSYTASLGSDIPRWRLFERWTPQGVWALLWAHSLLLVRMAWGMVFSWAISFGIMLVLLIVLANTRYGQQMYLHMALVTLYMSSFFILLFSQVLLVVAVRRAEMNKALPFPTRQVVLMEVLPPSIIVWFLQTVSWGVFCLLLPEHWRTLTSHYLIIFSTVPLWHTGLFLLYVILPDQSDYTQRVLFGVLLFPLLFILTLPAVAVWLIVLWLDWPTVTASIAIVAVNALATWVLTGIAGERYAQMSLVD